MVRLRGPESKLWIARLLEGPSVPHVTADVVTQQRMQGTMEVLVDCAVTLDGTWTTLLHPLTDKDLSIAFQTTIRSEGQAWAR